MAPINSTEMNAPARSAWFDEGLKLLPPGFAEVNASRSAVRTSNPKEVDETLDGL